MIRQCVKLTIKTYYTHEDEGRNADGEKQDGREDSTQIRGQLCALSECTLGVPGFGLVGDYNIAENLTHRSKWGIEVLIPETSANEDF